jgi:hypothetical protein
MFGAVSRECALALFLVPRTEPFAGESDLDAAMFRALLCAQSFPGFKWIRTYYTEDSKKAFCVYEANSADDVRAYSRLANIPYDAVIEVEELTRETYWTPAFEDAATPGELAPALAN